MSEKQPCEDINCNGTNCGCSTFVYIPDFRATFAIDESNNAELRKIIKELQDLESRRDGVNVTIGGDQIELKAGATLEEFQAFVHKLLRLVIPDEESAHADLTLASDTQFTGGILDYVFDRHCTNFNMIRNLALIVRLGEKTTMFVFFTGMNNCEIEMEIDAHKAELGL